MSARKLAYSGMLQRNKAKADGTVILQVTFVLNGQKFIGNLVDLQPILES